MAEYTIPKPYRDFYVTDPISELINDCTLFSETITANNITRKNTIGDKACSCLVGTNNLLLPYESTTVSQYDATLTVQSDGGILGSGTPTGSIALGLKTIEVIENANYILSANGIFSNMVLYITLFEETTVATAIERTINNRTITFNPFDYGNITKMTLGVKRGSNNVTMSGALYPELKIADGTPVNVYASGEDITDFGDPSTFTTYQTSVGETISVTQFEGYTNLVSSINSVSLSTKFVLSPTLEQLDNIRVEIGLFANRPTDTKPYNRLYIATDKTDTSRSMILPAQKSGLTSSNWIYI